jgi:hypothetical protein
MSYLSKFYGIKFPAFALYSVPFDYKIGTDTIQIQKREFHDWYIIDRFDRNKTVLERYLSVKSDEINFDATCLNLTHVINKPVKWLIDSKAKIYDVSKKQKFISKSLPIIKVSKNAVWVPTVSYPFELPIKLIDSKELLNQHLTIVKIDKVWVIYKVTPFKMDVTEINI